MNIVLYHKHCNDGLFAAFACWLKFKHNALYIPVNYKPIQDITPKEAILYILNEKNHDKYKTIGDSNFSVNDIISKTDYKDIDLYLVDYSLPVEHFKYCCSLFKTVTVLDHHHSAVKEYSKHFEFKEIENDWLCSNPTDNSKIVFSEKESGALLTYNYLEIKESETIKDCFKLISDRDLWEFKLKNTKSFHYGTSSVGFTSFRSLYLCILYSFNTIMNDGNVVLKTIHTRIVNTSKNKIDINITIDNIKYKGTMVNTELDLASDLCDSIINEGYDIVIAYAIKENTSVSCSVRSNSKVDSSIISVANGGGGHKQASGFRMTLNDLSNILNTKSLEV